MNVRPAESCSKYKQNKTKRKQDDGVEIRSISMDSLNYLELSLMGLPDIGLTEH